MPSCHYHSKNEELHKCVQCQRGICGACTIEVEGEPFCQICWDGNIAHIRNLQKMKNEIDREIPWQRWKELGPIKAFFETAGQVVFQSGFFFSHLTSRKDMTTPLLFALVCVLVFWFPMYVINIKVIFPSILDNYMQTQSAGLANETGQASTTLTQVQMVQQQLASITGFDILQMPFKFILFNFFIASLLQQFMISLFRGHEGYTATFQIRCYAMIAQCLLVIPVFGIILAEIGSVLVCFRGFQIVQKLTFSQSLCVALVPFIFLLI